MSDDLLLEADRYPRLPARIWRCPICAGGGTMAVVLFGQPWIVCGCCGLRDHRFDVGAAFDPVDDDDAAMLFAYVGSLDAVDEICPPMVRPFVHIEAKQVPMPSEIKTDPKYPLLNRRLTLKAQADAQAAAKQKAEEESRRVTPPTKDELELWTTWVRFEPEDKRAIRLRTVDRFERQVGFGYRVGGELLPAEECAKRLRLGAPLQPFIDAEGKGGIWMRDRRRS